MGGNDAGSAGELREGSSPESDPVMVLTMRDHVQATLLGLFLACVGCDGAASKAESPTPATASGAGAPAGEAGRSKTASSDSAVNTPYQDAAPASSEWVLQRLALSGEALEKDVSWGDVARARKMHALAYGTEGKQISAAKVKMFLTDGPKAVECERKFVLGDWKPLQGCSVTKVEATPTLSAAVLKSAPESFAPTAELVAAAEHYRATCGQHNVELSVTSDGTIVALEHLIEMTLAPL